MSSGDVSPYRPLRPLEEIEAVEKRVPHPDRDAVIRVVRAFVVDVVMFFREDEAEPLKKGRQWRRRVHMRPFMELVRQKNAEAKKEEERPEEISPRSRRDRGEEPYEDHRGKAREAIIPVRVNEVVACDPLRIHMVVAERLYEIRAEERRVVVPEIVEGEVYETRGEIGDDDTPRRRVWVRATRIRKWTRRRPSRRL